MSSGSHTEIRLESFTVRGKVRRTNTRTTQGGTDVCEFVSTRRPHRSKLEKCVFLNVVSKTQRFKIRFVPVTSGIISGMSCNPQFTAGDVTIPPVTGTNRVLKRCVFKTTL